MLLKHTKFSIKLSRGEICVAQNDETNNWNKYSDRISTKQLLYQTNSLSVNQIRAQVKIQELWKGINIKKYPLIKTQSRIFVKTLR